MTRLADLGEEEFVLLTTYRRSGVAVSVPVWIAPDGRGALLVTTTGRSGKVKRLRRDRRVELRACDRRGVVSPEAAVVGAEADLVHDPGEVRRLRELIRDKYGERMKVTAADQGVDDPEEPARVIVRITGTGRRDDDGVGVGDQRHPSAQIAHAGHGTVSPHARAPQPHGVRHEPRPTTGDEPGSRTRADRSDGPGD